MATEQENLSLEDRRAALLATLAARLGDDVTSNPSLADAINRQIDELVAAAVAMDAGAPLPPDKGLAQLVGVGPEAAEQTRPDPRPAVRSSPTTRPSPPSASSPSPTCTTSTSTRGSACSGPSSSCRSCSEPAPSASPPARAPTGCTSSTAARCCATPATTGWPPTGVHSATATRRWPAAPAANTDFHPLFSHFNNQVALFWRDKRISDVHPRARL